MTVSDKEKSKRLKFTNIEVYKKLEKLEKIIIMTCAHFTDYKGISCFKKNI